MYTACAHDYFCGGGGYFDCAADYHAEAATNATRDEALALDAALEGYPADIQAEVRAANVSSTSAAAMADELLAAQSTGGDGDDVPEWAIALIAVFAAFGLGCCCAAVFLAKREKVRRHQWADALPHRPPHPHPHPHRHPHPHPHPRPHAAGRSARLHQHGGGDGDGHQVGRRLKMHDRLPEPEPRSARRLRFTTV